VFIFFPTIETLFYHASDDDDNDDGWIGELSLSLSLLHYEIQFIID